MSHPDIPPSFRECWISHARWPENVYTDMSGSHVSTDDHDTKEQAENVCRRLLREGFGCVGEKFPLEVWVTRFGDST